MKIKNLLMLVLITAVLFNACKEESTTEPEAAGDNYFPGTNGSYYKYNTEIADSNKAGTRSSTYQGMQLVAGTNYQVQIDSTFLAGEAATGISLFRKTDNGVFYFLDTTGLSEIIPDSILQFINLDAELRLFSFPLTEGKTWPVFKLSLLVVPVVEVNANYVGKENINLNLTSGTVTREAAKIRYELKIQILNPQNPLQIISTSVFEAFAWVIADIGIAKWQGNATILGALSGGGIDFGDTTAVASQTLVDYNIK